MIILKTDAQIEIMRKAGKIVAETLEMIGDKVKPGITTAEIDRAAEEFILSRGAKPAFKGYRGFPATTCISINEEVVHGIPGNRMLVEGQIVSVDLGCIVNGFYGDSAATFPVGQISEEKRKLIEVTRRSLEVGLSHVKDGNKLGQVSAAIQKCVEDEGFSVVRDMVGHGIGKNLHEDPQVPHFGPEEAGPVLKKGMVIAIEPMVNAGGYQVVQKADGWTIVTADGSDSAHFEHSVAVTDNGLDILTKL
ncbi:MAG: type I methionyl aminopeptidase [Candidatus Zixiibacteriota bacterium]|nr:MAG: type I methionyl aminopeptidase [candidate division Zixibacteria bacterium]HDL04082.1 type I methionyl aminopeptidase [candidate division Zixibacteria bacterium]